MTEEEKKIAEELAPAAGTNAAEAADGAGEAAENPEEAAGNAAENPAEAAENAENAAEETLEDVSFAEETAEAAPETLEEVSFAGEAAEAAETSETAAEPHAESRRNTKKGVVKKVVLISLAAVLVLVGGGVALVNHYLNSMERLNPETQTTLSPEEFMSLIGIDTTEEAASSLEKDTEVTETETETEAISTEETTAETESETESTLVPEETERIIMIDPDETNVVVIEETTMPAPVVPTAPTAVPTQPYIPAYSYEWTKAPSLNDEGLINIVLVGDDSRGSGNSRSDVIMLLSINPNSKRVSLISFMRDMYLPIQGGYSSRINHAYEAGGFPLLYQCLNNNFGLHIDGGVRLDFTGFSKAVDAIGGVDISLTAAEANAMMSYLKTYSGRYTDPSTIHEGSCHLDGNAALAYCRIRKIDSDFSRTARQRKMLTILFNKFKSPSAMNAVLSAVLPYCGTDMSNATIWGYAGQIVSSIGGIYLNSYRLPADGAYRAVNIRGMDVLQSVQSLNINALRSYLPY